MAIRPVQPVNGPFTMLVTLAGIVTSARRVQLPKAAPIMMTPLRSVTLLRLVQP